MPDIYTNGSNSIQVGTSANEIFVHSQSRDTYIFTNGWGQDTLADATGTNVLDFSAVTNSLNIVTLGARIVFDSQGNGLTLGSSNIAEIIGGSASDTIYLNINN